MEPTKVRDKIRRIGSPVAGCRVSAGSLIFCVVSKMPFGDPSSFRISYS